MKERQQRFIEKGHAFLSTLNAEAHDFEYVAKHVPEEIEKERKKGTYQANFIGPSGEFTNREESNDNSNDHADIELEREMYDQGYNMDEFDNDYNDDMEVGRESEGDETEVDGEDSEIADSEDEEYINRRDEYETKFSVIEVIDTPIADTVKSNQCEEDGKKKEFNPYVEFDSNPYAPYLNRMDFTSMQFFHAGKFDYSIEQTKAIMAYALEMVAASHDLREKEARKMNIKLPALNVKKDFPSADRILNYEKLASNKFPEWITSQHIVKKDSQQFKVSMNLPSNIIKWLLSIREKSSKLSRLSDHTPDQLRKLNRGNKWKSNMHLKCPMTPHQHDLDSPDLWIGDKVQHGNDSIYFVISNFISYEDEMMIEGYELLENEESSLEYIFVECTKVPLKDLNFETIERFPYRDGFSFSSIRTESVQGSIKFASPDFGLTKEHSSFFQIVGDIRKKAVELNVPKARLIPITLFSDETSANFGSQYNCLDSWIMTPAALDYHDRNKPENQPFIGVENLGYFH